MKGPTRFSERDGRELALVLLRQIMETGDRCSLDCEIRPTGTPQDNIALSYLHSLQERNSDELNAGFASILTDFLQVTLAGSSPDLYAYECQVDHPT